MTQLSRRIHDEPEGGTCVFTVDLEEYFEVRVLRELIQPAEWGSLPQRSDRSVDALLGHLARHGARATFFVSPWIAESRPEVVQKVVSAGHEIGVLVRSPSSDIDRERWSVAWREDLRETRERLEQVTGSTVLGCRSARFHHALPVSEAVDILADEGFRYDATLSREAIRSEFGGTASGDSLQLPTSHGPLLAVPPSTLNLFGRRLFTAGRTAFRILPYHLTRHVLTRAISGGRQAVFSMRSWEMDPAQPTLPVSLTSRIRLYWGLQRVRARLTKLLQEFAFDSAAGALGLLDAQEPDGPPGGASEAAGRPGRRVPGGHR